MSEKPRKESDKKKDKGKSKPAKTEGPSTSTTEPQQSEASTPSTYTQSSSAPGPSTVASSPSKSTKSSILPFMSCISPSKSGYQALVDTGDASTSSPVKKSTLFQKAVKSGEGGGCSPRKESPGLPKKSSIIVDLLTSKKSSPSSSYGKSQSSPQKRSVAGTHVSSPEKKKNLSSPHSSQQERKSPQGSFSGGIADFGNTRMSESSLTAPRQISGSGAWSQALSPGRTGRRDSTTRIFEPVNLPARTMSSSSQGQRSASSQGQRSASSQGQRSPSSQGQRSASSQGQRSASSQGQLSAPLMIREPSEEEIYEEVDLPLRKTPSSHK